PASGFAGHGHTIAHGASQGALCRGNKSAALPEKPQPRRSEPPFERTDTQAAVEVPAAASDGNPDPQTGTHARECVFVAAGLDGQSEFIRQVVAMQNLLDAPSRVGHRFAQNQWMLDDLRQSKRS